MKSEIQLIGRRCKLATKITFYGLSGLEKLVETEPEFRGFAKALVRAVVVGADEIEFLDQTAPTLLDGSRIKGLTKDEYTEVLQEVLLDTVGRVPPGVVSILFGIGKGRAAEIVRTVREIVGDDQTDL